MKSLLMAVFVLLFVPHVYADPLIPLINQHRLIPLTEDYRLDLSATEKACDMEKNHYWSHVDLQGKYSWHLFTKHGYWYQKAGEDMAEGFQNDQQIIQAWLNSPIHKIVMENPAYKNVGIGRCGIFVVAHFGRL